MRGGEAVRQARIVEVYSLLDQLGGPSRRSVDRHDLIALAMYEQGRNIKLLQVFVKLGLRKGRDGVIRVLEAALHTPEKELVQDALRDLGSRTIGAVERDRQLPVELRAIRRERGPHQVDRFDRQTFRGGMRLLEARTQL